MPMIEIFSGPNCGYCARAKTLLSERNLAYSDLDISHDENRRELLKRLPRSKTIPQIFIDGEHIGGCEDLEILDQKGELKRLMDPGAQV
ncbi:MAG: glutaredoxin 3 [Betaproteobacteria bacterium HGW-Betaproteobacteria-3]|nr:MAG: glutaredoxin 3 [Betaproteobacteria bacterium HGW-Betaproteobacteria-3]